MYTYLLAITGFSMYYSLYYITKDKMNPQGTFLLIWYFTAALSSISSLYDTSLQQEWSIKMMLIVFFSGVSFYIPSLLLAKRTKMNLETKIKFTSVYYMVTDFLMLMSILVFVIRFSTTGFEITLFSDASDKKSLIPPAIPFLNYFELLTPYLSLVGIFELGISRFLSKKRKIIIILYILFAIPISSLLFSISRGTLMIPILGTLYFLNIKYRPSWFKIFLFSFIFFLFVSSFSFLRLGEGSSVFTLFGNSIFSMLFSSFYSYIAMNFNNLNKLVNAHVELTGFWYSLEFLLKPFFANEYRLNLMHLHNFDTLFFNARTYLYAFYSDLGIIGTLLYPFLLGVFISLIVRISNLNSMYILLLLALQKAIFVTFFGNYFFSQLVLLFPYIIILLIIYSNKIVLSKPFKHSKLKENVFNETSY